MLKDALFALWFFFPAAIANLTPILVAKMPWLKKFEAPIDGGLMYRGKRLLGSHKTWRGLVTGVIMATVVLWLQQLSVDHWHWAQWLTGQVDYTKLPTLILGPLFGIGALGGDAIESFFKRQRGVAPGHGWFPFDQIDYIIGGALVSMPFVTLSIFQYCWLIILWLIIHVVASYIGWLTGFKERPI
jgi:CDP-2,3-bis-(O-geranylgeranyl)-sn-glycerol synthase